MAGFAREAQMKGLVIDSHQWCTESRLIYARHEVPVGGQIPDIVFVGVGGEPTLDAGPRRWTLKHSGVAWALRVGGPLYVAEIADAVCERSERVLPIVEDLIDGNVARATPGGKVALRRNTHLLRSEVIAIELKLARWRDALAQALSYRLFANRVLVALDRTRATSVDLQAFRSEGVGLVLVGPGKVETAVPPKRMKSNSLGLEHDYVVGSALWGNGHTLWKRRCMAKASAQAWT